MFRKMRRFKQQLPNEECIEILINEPRGVLAVCGDGGYPYAVPMDHFYDAESGKLYFHCAAEGHKIESVRKDPKVSYCVYDKGYKNPGDWALNIRSVIVFGTIRELEDREEIIKMVRKIGLKYYPAAEDVEEEIRQSGHRVACLELTIDHMTGKLVNEK